MLLAAHTRIYETKDLVDKTTKREGEIKLGEALTGIDASLLGEGLSGLRGALAEKAKHGVRYALLGIPEDIGARANCGRGGSSGAWEAFLRTFVNIQANEYIDPSKFLVVGEVDVLDIQKQSTSLDSSTNENLDKLRSLCSQIDDRVTPIIQQIIGAGIEPIVIGGGHNNAYPIQRGIAAAQLEKGKQIGVACINCDPHADFRAIEGRHSGNGFSYSHKEGILKSYYIIGLHESYNSQTLLTLLKKAKFSYSTFEDIKVRNKISWKEAIDQAIKYLKKEGSGFPLAMELDLDSIAFLPVSAETPIGLTCEEAAQFVYSFATTFTDIAYFHLPEGAPILHSSVPTGERYVGRTISSLVLSYIKAREERL